MIKISFALIDLRKFSGLKIDRLKYCIYRLQKLAKVHFCSVSNGISMELMKKMELMKSLTVKQQ